MSNFLERFRGTNQPSSFGHERISASTFEQDLFRGGVLVFEHSRFIVDATDNYRDRKSWYDNNPYWDEQRTVMSLERDKQELQHEHAWQHHFSGQVPRNWNIWHNAQDAFEEAGKQGVQLSETLVNAGISYDHHLVANATGKSQLLKITQIAFVFARELPEWNRQQILEAQRSRGVTEDEIRRAKQIAEDLLSRKLPHTQHNEGFWNLAIPDSNS